ncbi:MAG: 50S ribosomal protein L23 [Calditrichaeota bacterium]|nr:50S ribosomal protein L23 [Calditrichota bacterium]MCB9472289.1 50S ribosomal protein L23 [Candidatus Delongbacteria bacterium]
MTSNKPVLVHPLLTEKMMVLQDERNQYGFVVAKGCNKLEIKSAVEKQFGVSVEDVRTMNVAGKLKRQGKFVGRRSSWKKAIVTLKQGDRIEIVEGV